MVFQLGMGCGALLSLTTMVKMNLMIVGAMYMISVPLYLIMVYCSKPPVYKVYEMPTFFEDE